MVRLPNPLAIILTHEEFIDPTLDAVMFVDLLKSCLVDCVLDMKGGGVKMSGHTLLGFGVIVVVHLGVGQRSLDADGVRTERSSARTSYLVVDQMIGFGHIQSSLDSDRRAVQLSGTSLGDVTLTIDLLSQIRTMSEQ